MEEENKNFSVVMIDHQSHNEFRVVEDAEWDQYDFSSSMISLVKTDLTEEEAEKLASELEGGD